ncbi:exopolysaccharide biosynthesis polyprenyl glycosylphosphotransferase [Horticoccus sp. 23ND18S-11]|uniref:exopolysaccharide biosynthesis polyprenyl glycosylphosphotransferase n=1 Tax=Horticoccus sp. 23ND18S-11 TaxID=3391832 RepID=UPI0039C911E4
MITTRARGLANLHAGVTTLCVGIFFWVYAEFILRYVPIVRLTRQVNLLPYFFCVVSGMIVSTRDLSQLVARFHRLDLGDAARLSARQVGLMAALIFTMMFATQDRSISRLFLGTLLVWSGLGLLVLNAWLPRLLARIAFPRGKHLPTVFIGRTSSLAGLKDWIAQKEPLGLHAVGLLSDETTPTDAAALPMPWLGRVHDLARVLAERQVGQVVLLQLPATDNEARAIIELCQEQGCRLLIHNNLAERYTQPLVPTLEEGRHFYTLQEEPLEDPLNRIIKRTYDLALALPMVVFVLPPLCAWVWIMQRVQAPGPLFHVRERRGQRGEVFRMLKFRSMRVSPEDAAAESKQAQAEDERIFPFGRFLRRRSLDEFPQFWNVLCGDMSVVGPRPYMPLLDEEFRQQTRGYRTRHLVKPGITGLAQSLGFRGEILETEMLNRRVYWDLYYITHWSVWLDLQISARTLNQVLRPPPTAY